MGKADIQFCRVLCQKNTPAQPVKAAALRWAALALTGFARMLGAGEERRLAVGLPPLTG